MEQKNIYHIILAVLEEEATARELNKLENWLAQSDENRIEFEGIKQLYQKSVLNRKEETFNTDRAWKQVSKQTIGKTKKNHFKTWLPYVAMVAILFTVTYYLLSPELPPVESVVKSPMISSDTFGQPTLVLENGQQISLEDNSFAIKENNILIKNDPGTALQYEPQNKSVTKEQIKKNKLVIPYGNTYNVILSDGTSVHLNSGSILIYPDHFTGETREVTLIGEAYFDVSKNKEKPFIVKTEKIDIRVTGTSFNVSCYKEDTMIRTVLVEGAISILTQNGDEKKIRPAELFTLHKETGDTYLETVNTELYTCWTEDKYIFKKETLSNIITRLQRWHNFTVTYEHEDIKQKYFSFTVDRSTSMEQLLEVISYTLNLQAERINNHINIQRKEEK